MSSENRNPLLRIINTNAGSNNESGSANLTRETLYTVWSRIQNLSPLDREAVLSSLNRNVRPNRISRNIENESENEDNLNTRSKNVFNLTTRKIYIS